MRIGYASDVGRKRDSNEDRYYVDLFGRTGEPLSDRPVQFQIKHRDFKEIVNVPLETAENR